MRIVFIRHGERRRGESDPALTSAGRRMARETAEWLEAQGVRPAHVLNTPTQRTRETAEELCLVFPNATSSERPESPEVGVDWEQLVDVLEADPGAEAPIVLVGHHPTVDLLLRAFGPAPAAVPRQNFASALVLDRTGGGWKIAAAWPGRAS
jgi:phosphohistidine phosphatase SixA